MVKASQSQSQNQNQPKPQSQTMTMAQEVPLSPATFSQEIPQKVWRKMRRKGMEKCGRKRKMVEVKVKVKAALFLLTTLTNFCLLEASSSSSSSSASFSSSSANGIFAGQCPEPLCECTLDWRGRMEIACLNGQMTDIPMGRMNPSTEVIKIIGPKDRPNFLTIGRLFRQFKRLEELHIVGSNIPNIGENSYWGMVSLRVLNLSSNNISQIVESNFKGLVNVENVSLADNSVESLVSASFQHMPQLRFLDLSSNKMTKLVERLFYNLHLLEVLDISHNPIKELNPDVFRDIWRLRDLRCRRCFLKTINPLLYALLPGIEILDLGENEFKYLNKEEFKLPRLHTLLLDGNQISAIVDYAFSSHSMAKLSLGSNRIVRIDRLAFFNSSISALDISGNKFESLDKHTFASLRTRDALRSLDLSRSPRLKTTPLIMILGENPQLEKLSLAQCDLEELPLDLFELQGQLRFLNLSGNFLTEIYFHQLSHLHNLQVLDLSSNRIKGLDRDVLLHIDRVASFRDIRLENNPWHCDLCHIVPLLQWVQRSHFFKDVPCSSTACLRCQHPPNLQGRSILSLEESALDWCSSGAEPISILSGSLDDPRLGLFLGCAIIVVILISAAIYVIAKARWHAAHYYTHEGDRPEIATPPVPPPLVQDGNGHFQGDTGNGNGPLPPLESHGPPGTVNGFDNLMFHNGNGHNGHNQCQYQTENGHWSSPGLQTEMDHKMIATIEEMTYETQLAYPELAPIHLTMGVTPGPPRVSSASGHSSGGHTSSSSRSTPIYCCPGHHHQNNNHGHDRDTPPHSQRRSNSNNWNNNNQHQSFRRY